MTTITNQASPAVPAAHTAATREAVANANAYVSNAGLPLYTHITELLREAVRIMPLATRQRVAWFEKASAAIVAIPEPQFHVMNADGLYYSKLGTTKKWVCVDAEAEVMTRNEAEQVARMEGATAVAIV